MDSSPFKTFNAKILLFGEHLINLGSDALSIPYRKFNGKLIRTEKSEQRLALFLNFLTLRKFDFLDEKKLVGAKDLAFSSNIPMGYGCGSSGAIVAACYDYLKSDDIEDLKVLQSRFAMMEAFYHGKSSGTDPLISYLNEAIRFSRDKSIQLIPDLNISLDNYSLILIDSGQPREGKKYIKWFMERANDDEFKSILKEELVPATQKIINSFLDNAEYDFMSNFSIISKIQAEHMGKMIPDRMKKLWNEGSVSGELFLKICGAGGGGFFIGLLRNNAQLTLLKDYNTYSLL